MSLYGIVHFGRSYDENLGTAEMEVLQSTLCYCRNAQTLKQTSTGKHEN